MTRAHNGVIAITGAARGLGRAYALRLRSSGSIAIIDSDAEAAEKTAEDIRGLGGRASAFRADVSNEREVANIMRKISDDLGPIDRLINNAGGLLGAPAPVEDIGAEQWHRVIGVNLGGAWFCSQAVVPQMKALGSGCIINVSTTMLSHAYPTGCAPYIAAKGGVVGLTRALARELGAFGIRVNAIAPGLIPMDKANGNDARASKVREALDRVVSQQCLDKVGSPDDVCGTVEWLLSEASAFVTGQVIHVDGGWALA